MKSKLILGCALVATAGLVAAFTLPAGAHDSRGARGMYADGDHHMMYDDDHMVRGRQHMMREDDHMFGEDHHMMEGYGHHGGYGMRGGYGPHWGEERGGYGPMHSQSRGFGAMRGMMGRFDADDDGFVSVDELRDGLMGQLTEFDGDGDGNLSLAEFEDLYAAVMRARIVDRFQYMDNDGDGQITEEEMMAPIRMLERRQRRMERLRELNREDSGRRRGMMQEEQ